MCLTVVILQNLKECKKRHDFYQSLTKNVSQSTIILHCRLNAEFKCKEAEELYKYKCNRTKGEE